MENFFFLQSKDNRTCEISQIGARVSCSLEMLAEHAKVETLELKLSEIMKSVKKDLRKKGFALNLSFEKKIVFWKKSCLLKLEIPCNNVISSSSAVSETEKLKFSGISEVFSHTECPEGDKNQDSSKIKQIYRKKLFILTKQAAGLITVKYFAVKDIILSFISWFIWAVLVMSELSLPRLIRSQLVSGLKGLTQMEARHLLLTEFVRHLLCRFLFLSDYSSLQLSQPFWTGHFAQNPLTALLLCLQVPLNHGCMVLVFLFDPQWLRNAEGEYCHLYFCLVLELIPSLPNKAKVVSHVNGCVCNLSGRKIMVICRLEMQGGECCEEMWIFSPFFSLGDVWSTRGPL